MQKPHQGSQAESSIDEERELSTLHLQKENFFRFITSRISRFHWSEMNLCEARRKRFSRRYLLEGITPISLLFFYFTSYIWVLA